MLLVLRDIAYGSAIIAGLGTVYTTLGALNGRLAGGLTLQNRPWALCLGVFVGAVIACAVIKLILLGRRRRQKPFRAHPSGRGWVQDD